MGLRLKNTTAVVMNEGQVLLFSLFPARILLWLSLEVMIVVVHEGSSVNSNRFSSVSHHFLAFITGAKN